MRFIGEIKTSHDFTLLVKYPETCIYFLFNSYFQRFVQQDIWSSQQTFEINNQKYVKVTICHFFSGMLLNW